MNTFEWESGVVIEPPYIEIDGTKYYVQAGTVEGGTPATANNLNEMENILNDNVVNQYKIIFENVAGTETNLICSENPSNFDYLQFDFLHQDYHASSIVPLIDNKIEISSLGIPSGNTVLQLINQRYTINGSTLEFDICGMVNMSNRTISYQAFENRPALKIKRVVGIKRYNLTEE